MEKFLIFVTFASTLIGWIITMLDGDSDGKVSVLSAMEYWVVESKKHWWNKWKKVGSYSNKGDAYKKLNELKML